MSAALGDGDGKKRHGRAPGFTMTQEHRDRISARARERYADPAYREKFRLAHQGARHGIQWDAELDATLRALRAAGLPWTVIGARMGIDWKVCHARLLKVGGDEAMGRRRRRPR